MTKPLVSVVLATYNRSAILAFAIESVRRSTLTDWELLVVGDCCTDATAEVVAALDDPRIRFLNLPRNVGEQSGPNNMGVSLARGQYLAFLNHDDLYFPDHLEQAIAFLQSTGSDMAWSPILTVLPTKEADLQAGRWHVRLWGVTPTDDYDPRVFAFASAWILRRSLADRIGPWRHAHDVFVTPSQDWIFRAWKSGARIRLLSHPTVMAIPGGARKGSYVDQQISEHHFFSELMRNEPSRLREHMLGCAAVAAEREVRGYRLRHAVRAFIGRSIRYVADWLGVHPHAPRVVLTFGRRGSLVNSIRRVNGLEPLPARLDSPGP